MHKKRIYFTVYIFEVLKSCPEYLDTRHVPREKIVILDRIVHLQVSDAYARADLNLTDANQVTNNSSE